MKSGLGSDMQDLPGVATRFLTFRRQIPKVFGFLAFLIGIIDLIVLLLPINQKVLVERLSGLPGIFRGPTVLSSFAASLGLILIADGLARGKKRAFYATSFLLVLVLLNRFSLFRADAIGIVQLTIPFVILVLLVASKSFFAAKPAPFSMKLSFLFVVIGGLVTFGLTAFVVWLRLTELKQGWSWNTYFTYGIPGMVGMVTPLSAEDSTQSDMTYFALAGLGLGYLCSIFYNFMRSHKPLGKSDLAEATKLKSLYDASGITDSLSYFALRDDKLMCWSPDGKACIVYRVELGVALAGGDPIGQEESWPAAMAAFVDLAHTFGWLVGVISASERAANMWAEFHGYYSLHMGDEAIVKVEKFDLIGRRMKNVRNAVTRARRRGYSVNVKRLHQLGEEEVEQLRNLSTTWRVGKVERGFSMALGRIDARRDPDILVVRAYQENQLHGFMTFVPWGSDGASLDFMRRHPAAANGINELLLVELITWSKANGIGQISLNFATFRKLLEQGSSNESTPLTKLGRAVLLIASRYIQIETLHRFNAKFDPVWQPRFLVFESRREFIRAGLSALAAEGFL